jgi:hypothetical protein
VVDIAFPAKSKSAAKTAAHELLEGNQRGLGKLIAGPPVSLQGLVSHGAFQQERISAKPGWYVRGLSHDDAGGNAPHGARYGAGAADREVGAATSWGARRSRERHRTDAVPICDAG